MMLRAAVKEMPGCDGVVLGGHGLFTWGETQRESYLNTITIIDQLGQFIECHRDRKGTNLWRAKVKLARPGAAEDCYCRLMPFLRGGVSHETARDWQFYGFRLKCWIL